MKTNPSIFALLAVSACLPLACKSHTDHAPGVETELVSLELPGMT